MRVILESKLKSRTVHELPDGICRSPEEQRRFEDSACFIRGWLVRTGLEVI